MSFSAFLRILYEENQSAVVEVVAQVDGSSD